MYPVTGDPPSDLGLSQPSSTKSLSKSLITGFDGVLGVSKNG